MKRLIFFAIIFASLSLASAEGYVVYKGWLYNATSNNTGNVLVTYNYTSLTLFDYIDNPLNLDVYSYNMTANVYSPLNATLNTNLSILTFYNQGFPKLFRLGESYSYQINDLSINHASHKLLSSNYKMNLSMSDSPKAILYNVNYKIKMGD